MAEPAAKNAFSFTPERAKAKMEQGEMISSKEARDRKTIGYTLMTLHFLVNLYHYYRAIQAADTWLPPHQQTAAGYTLGATGIMFYQQGRDSQ